MTVGSKLTFRRSGGRVGPRASEDLTVEPDGRFRLWRSVNAGPIGLFEGTLSDTEASGLADEIKAAQGEDPPVVTPSMDAVSETLNLGDKRLTVGQYDKPSGPWGALMTRSRRLLSELTSQPVAAIALEADPKGRAARLVHRGAKPIEIDLSRVVMGAQVFGPGYVSAGNWTETFAEGGKVSAGPGWSIDLPFSHGLPVPDDHVVQTRVEFVASDGQLAIPVMMVFSPSPPS